MPYSLSARWVFPVSMPPMADGVVEIVDGRIVDIHSRPHAHTVSLGNVALLPGLINAHTHLEFSDLAEPVQPALPFTDWIKSLVSVRRANPATPAVLQRGLDECLQTGTVAIGEIATQDWSDTDYATSMPGAMTAFRELIGLTAERAATQLSIARQWLQSSPGHSGVQRGLSPHAPYSVRPSLYADLCHLAAQHGAPVAVHLAETQAELELLEAGTGEFVTMLQRFQAWDDAAIARETRPLDYLYPLAPLSRALVIHGNYLDQDEIAWLARHPHISVVYCPRTHAFFQHQPHPWRQMLDAGINVALGTDSRGSNPDLSLWREMRYLAQTFPEVDPATLLRMGTMHGAIALGLESDYGQLSPGKLARLAVVRLPDSGESDPYRALWAASDASLLADAAFSDSATV